MTDWGVSVATSEIVRMHLVALLASSIAWPFLRLVGLGVVPGWLAARAVGPAALSLLHLHLLRWTGLAAGGGTFWAVAAVTGLAAMATGHSASRVRKVQWRAIFRFEAGVAISVPLLCAILAAHYGGVALGERALDFGLLGSLRCDSAVPPADFWFAGERLHTYFLGQWTVADVARAAGAGTSPAYLFGLVHAWVQAVAACLIAARALGVRRSDVWIVPAAVLLLGNGAVAYRWGLDGHLPVGRAQLLAARVIPFTINENPAIAFWIAELHAHVLVISALVSWTALAIHTIARRSIACSVALGVVSALVVMTDAWMVPAAAFAVCALVVAALPLPAAFLVRAAVVAMFAAFVSSSAWLVGMEGFPLVFRRVEASTTRLHHLGVLFGPLLALVAMAYRSAPRGTIRTARGAALLLTALLLIAAGELVYLENWFSTPYGRQNTVFRFHFAAWIVMGLSLGGFLSPRRKRDRLLIWSWIVLFVILTALPALSGLSRARFDDFRRALEPQRDGRFEAAAWLSRNSPCGTVIAESTGLTDEGFATVSAMSGRSTLLGAHDKVFSHGISFDRIRERRRELRAIYCDEPSASEVLQRFGVKYIVLSPSESRAFPDCNPSVLPHKYPEVFRAGRTALLATDGERFGGGR